MKANVTYTLDEAGRRASLIAGGDGKENQNVTIDIAPADIDLMSINGDGSLYADATLGAQSAGATYELWRAHYFSAPPAAHELIAFLRARSLAREEWRARKKSEDEAKAEAAKSEARLKAIKEAGPMPNALLFTAQLNRVFAEQVANLTLYGAECGLCGKSADKPNPKCDQHEAFIPNDPDDPRECLNRLINEARRLTRLTRLTKG